MAKRVNTRTRRLTSRAMLLACIAVTASGCGRREPQTLHFARGAEDVVVTFHGEASDDSLFGAGKSLLDTVHPVDEIGKLRGVVNEARPGWLKFEYSVNGQLRELLVAKRPLLRQVSWDDIARAGAALGDDGDGVPGTALPRQNTLVADTAGNEYRVRLPRCGLSTLGALSEWNLLIGGVHRGDLDFVGAAYGWIASPYADEDLKVGYKGSLTWCHDARGGERVARGYFYVSRFHAAAPGLRTERLQWRPVLERVRAPARVAAMEGDRTQWSPSGRVAFRGMVSSDELFGPAFTVADYVPIDEGALVGDGRPDWLHFDYQGKSLLIAAKPVRHSVTWDAIAKAGAAVGDGSMVRVGWRFVRQNAVVKDRAGTRYRVRLLGCGQSTLDIDSEWNSLIGGVHKGDGDFVASPDGVYGWARPAFTDADLGLGISLGGSTWCRERITRKWRSHALNRGYFTVSRWHATETHFVGDGFGWRPVLERID